MNNMPSSQKLSVTEKVGYSLGGLAANLIFQTLVAFLAFFYTNVFGIPADKASCIIASAGTVHLPRTDSYSRDRLDQPSSHLQVSG